MLHSPVLLALLFGIEPTIRLLAPVDEPTRASEPSELEPSEASQLELDAAIGYEGDALPSPEIERPPLPPQARKIGSNTTLFVNFEGVHIGSCTPSNSHENCHWLKRNTTFEPYSGSLADRVAILDALRSLTADFGIRVTGRRPSDAEIYTMVVYGGDSEKEEALGRAPSGDCWDDYPNEIAYAFMDASRASWINGGASTALHEAAHTWGFDHVGLEGTLMAPSGGNTLSPPLDGCGQLVGDVAFEPEDEPSCPDINRELCGLSNYQHDTALLRMLFGAPYVDDQAPDPRLVWPEDGMYYEAPANFDVDIEILDDLDPQRYQIAVIVPGIADEPVWTSAYAADFAVTDLPVGSWAFEVRVRDEAGNEGSVAFTIEVGEEPARLDDGCACTSRSTPPGSTLLAWLGLVLLVRRRRR